MPVANGGTGSTSTTFVNLASNVTGTLPIANGGTNSTATPTAGGVVYGNGSAHAITSAGSSGQVLTSAGSGTPTWSTPSAAMTLISTKTSGFTWTGLSAYNYYVLYVSANSASAATLGVQVGYGSTTYQTSGYVMNGTRNTTNVSNRTTDTAFYPITSGATSNAPIFFAVNIMNFNDPNYVGFTTVGDFGNAVGAWAVGYVVPTSSLTAISIVGTFGGTASLYGISS